MPLSQIVSASIEDGAVAPVDLSSVAQYTGFKNRLINSLQATIPSNCLEIALTFQYLSTGTAGAADYFEITNVQLEKGVTATSFDYRPYGTELSLCQRYLPVLEANSAVSGFAATATVGYFSVPFKVTARVPATGLTVIGGGSMYSAVGTNLVITGTNFIAAGTGSCFIQGIVASGMSVGQGTLYYGPILLFNGCEL
jgi:hypothetical protein